MRPREDKPGVVTENEGERRYVYTTAAMHTVRLAMRKYNQAIKGEVEAALLEGIVVLMPSTAPGEHVVLDVDQARFVISGSHEDAQSCQAHDPDNARLYERYAESMEDALLRSYP